MTEKDVKSGFSIKKLILTSERHAGHPFAGRNAQELLMFKNKFIKFENTNINLLFYLYKNLLETFICFGKINFKNNF